MSIFDRAYRVDFLGKPQLVVDDDHLLGWAAERGVAPVMAPLEALESGIIPLRYLKNFRALSLEEQMGICRSRVLICGCGGLGGILISLLARAGVGHLRLVDGDAFVPSNLNRQLLCDTSGLSRSKAMVAAEQAGAINPLIEIEAIAHRLDETNADVLADGSDLVLDALDNLEGRFVLARAAQRREVHFVHAAVAGWWGQISTFPPGSPLDLRNVYGERRSRDPAEDSVGVLGPTAAIIGSLEALEALRILSGRGPAYAGRLLYFDGESGRMEIIPLQ